MQRHLILLHECKLIDGEFIKKPILIGTHQIINAQYVLVSFYIDGRRKETREEYATKIQSRGAMVETVYVWETPEEIYNLTNQPTA